MYSALRAHCCDRQFSASFFSAGGGRLNAFNESTSGFTPRGGEFTLLDTDKERDIFSQTVINSAIIPKANRLPLAGTELKVGGEWLRVKVFSVRLQVARIGMGLSCHYDGNDPYSGGYTFYLSDEWDPHWGGMLIAFNESTSGFTPPGGEFTLLDTEKERDIFSQTVINSAIIPKANRLVLLRNPIRHMVTPVLPSAGDRVRIGSTTSRTTNPVERLNKEFKL
ncbi:MAG: hypothetical protein DMG05_30225 [Acidobacteria bacterium]|nr:MAG: hypothetical protein DMG05_30225 [Acidobacteriota bacterium]